MPEAPKRTLNEVLDEPEERAGEHAVQDTRAEGLLEREHIRAQPAGRTLTDSLELFWGERAR